jgi:hypothetical protein
MPFTIHGHAVPGLPVEGEFEGSRARCGGPGLCVDCSKEAGDALRKFIREGNQIEEDRSARRNGQT